MSVSFTCGENYFSNGGFVLIIETFCNAYLPSQTHLHLYYTETNIPQYPIIHHLTDTLVFKDQWSHDLGVAERLFTFITNYNFFRRRRMGPRSLSVVISKLGHAAIIKTVRISATEVNSDLSSRRFSWATTRIDNKQKS